MSLDELTNATNCHGLQNAICNVVQNSSLSLFALQKIADFLLRELEVPISNDEAARRLVLASSSDWTNDARKKRFTLAVGKIFSKSISAAEAYKKLLEDFPELDQSGRRPHLFEPDSTIEAQCLRELIDIAMCCLQLEREKHVQLRNLLKKVVKQQVSATLACADIRARKLVEKVDEIPGDRP